MAPAQTAPMAVRTMGSRERLLAGPGAGDGVKVFSRGFPVDVDRNHTGLERPRSIRRKKGCRRDDGTLGTVVWAAECGARVLRVHDAHGAARAVDLLALLDTVEAA